PASPQALPSWQSRLLAHLNRHKRYPEDARRRGQQGVVKLRFVVDGRGQVLSFALAGKSGSASLDRATLQMIRRAQPLPVPPAELLQDGRLEVVAPFAYSLERR
ncbi:MAG TPA: energy transducer TonB, partial [Pseudomonas sp.]